MKAESDWDETKSIEERDAHIEMFKNDFEMDLNPEKMKKNPGRRYFAKQILNAVSF